MNDGLFWQRTDNFDKEMEIVEHTIARKTKKPGILGQQHENKWPSIRYNHMIVVGLLIELGQAIINTSYNVRANTSYNVRWQYVKIDLTSPTV